MGKPGMELEFYGRDLSAPLMQAGRTRARRGRAPGEGGLVRVWCSAGTQTVPAGQSVVDESYVEAIRGAANKNLRGWKKLLLAFLDQSIEDYRRAYVRAQRKGAWSPSGAAVRDWFFGEPIEVDRVGLVFESVCEDLGLMPSFIRKRLHTATPKGSRRNFARGARAGWSLDRRWPRRQPAPA